MDAIYKLIIFSIYQLHFNYLFPDTIHNFTFTNPSSLSMRKAIFHLSFVDERIEIIVNLPLTGSSIVCVVSLIDESANRAEVSPSMFFSIDKLSLIDSVWLSQGSYMSFILPVA